MFKRIGLLTTGGDCAGLNAALRAVTLRAIQGYGWQVFGINNGSNGLLRRPVKHQELTVKMFEGSTLRLGGTILGTTNRGDPNACSSLEETLDRFTEGLRELQIDGLISIGGDGSFKILQAWMARANIPFIAIPKTIDNDIGLTERAIGFATAVDVATEALDRLQPTAASHDRVMILEVMGRDAGHIALSAGIAGGADIILIPEIPYTMDSITRKIQASLKEGKNFALVVVSEAVRNMEGHLIQISDMEGRSRYGGIAHYLSDAITARTGAETRFTVLGHVQRGGQPDAADRILASAFGVHAVDLLAAGKTDRMVAWQNRMLTDVAISEAIKLNSVVSQEDALIRTARGLGICLGD